MLTAAQSAQLTTELQTDPEEFGYAALITTGDDEGLAALLTGPGKAADTLPPEPYTVQQLLLAVGAQGVGELSAAGLIGLLSLAGPTFDFGNSSVVQMVGALLTGANPQAPACPHCLSVVPALEAPTACSRIEKIWNKRGETVGHQQVAEALGRGGTLQHAARLAAASTHGIRFAMQGVPLTDAGLYAFCHAFGLPTGIYTEAGVCVGELHGVYRAEDPHAGALAQVVWYTDAPVPANPILDPTLAVVGPEFVSGRVLCTALRVKAG